MSALTLLQKAEPLVLLEEWRKAHDILRRARQLPSDPFLKAEIFSRDAECLQGLGRFRDAHSCYSSAYLLYKKLNVQSEQFSSLVGASSCLRILGKYSTAYRMWQSVEGAFVLKGIIPLGVPMERALVSRGLGLFSETRSRMRGVLQILRTQKNEDNLSERQHVYWILGGLERFTGHFLKARNCFKKAVVFAQNLKNGSAEAFALCGLAGVQRVLGDDLSSIRNYQRAHGLLKKEGDPFGEAYGLCGCANAFRVFGDAHKTLPLYRRSAAIYKRLGDESSEAFAYWGMGGSLRRLKSLDRADSFYRRALKLFLKSKDDRGHVMTRLGLARVAEDRGHRSLALREVSKAFSVADHSKLRYEKSLSLYERGRIRRPTRLPHEILRPLGISLSVLRRWRDIP
jgi:tetratricopeptide (TPR) repeat protein